MKKSLFALFAAFAAVAMVSCSNEQNEQDDVVESRSTETLTKEQANALAAELVKTNAYIDFDTDSLDQANMARAQGRITPVQVRWRVSLYRFYEGMAKVNDRFVQTKTARELNIAPDIYDFYVEEFVNGANKDLDDIDARRKNGEEVNFYMSDPTVEDNEQVIRF